MKNNFVKDLVQRCEFNGDGAASLNFAADILHMAGTEATRWSNRCDDAMRIQDVLSEAADVLRSEARKVVK